jgi:hypothetical protein
MTEEFLQGAIGGGGVIALVLLVIFICNFIWKIIRSPSEGARRFRIVGSIALALLVGSAMVAGMGPWGAIGSAIVIGAIVWVIRGFKKPTRESFARPNAEPRKEEREPEPTKFADSREVVPVRKTVITCPNCSGRLRVTAGKYIDVTCQHCQTVFRTHT